MLFYGIYNFYRLALIQIHLVIALQIGYYVCNNVLEKKKKKERNIIKNTFKKKFTLV